ncbi:MAG: glycosyltransferase family 1 protein [Clostridiales bacterium]|nr:glycosyltransferase family 1 protein [Clostridiales bacterium]
MNQIPVRVAQVMGKMDRGGVEAVVMNYYRALDRERIQFDFFVDETSSFPQRAEIEQLGGVCYLVPPYSKPLKYTLTLKKLFRQNGYVIVHSQINTMGVFPLLAAWLAGVKVRICHNHSTAHRKEGGRTALKYILRPFTRMLATHWFACGELSALWMYGRRALAAGRVRIMPNAIRLEQYAFSAEDRTAVRAEFHIEQDAFVMGHIGRFACQKNHPFLLCAFQALVRIRPDAVLLLVGEGQLMEEIRALAAKLGIDGSVRFAGARSDANRFYSAMDVFCLPSFYEGLPVVLLEALANGLPCIASDLITGELDRYAVRRLSLDSGAQAWAEALCVASRAAAPADGFAAEYDIRQAAVGLEEYYFSRLREFSA